MSGFYGMPDGTFACNSSTEEALLIGSLNTDEVNDQELDEEAQELRRTAERLRTVTGRNKFGPVYGRAWLPNHDRARNASIVTAVIGEVFVPTAESFYAVDIEGLDILLTAQRLRTEIGRNRFGPVYGRALG